MPQAEEKMRGRPSRASSTADIPRLGVDDGVLDIIEEGSIGTAADMGGEAPAERDVRLSLSGLVSEVQRLASVLVKVSITYRFSISALLHVSTILWTLLRMLSHVHKS